MNINTSHIIAMLINPMTDGAMPIACDLINTGNAIQIKYGGLEGWIIQIPIHELQDVIDDDDLHG